MGYFLHTSLNAASMISFKSLIAFLALLGLCIGACEGGRAQSGKPAFSMKIKAVNERVTPGSDVEIDILLTNVSTKELVFNKFGRRDRDFQVEIRNSLGKEPPLTKEYDSLIHPKSALDLSNGSSHHYYAEPGQTIVEKIRISEMFNLNTPEKYTIQVQRFDKTGKIEVKSNVVTVSVARP
jgi:hypothetical protein